MEEWLKIRQRVLVEGMSKRAVLRETGLHWQTLEKILSHGGPPGYQLSEPRQRPKIGPYLDRIRGILEEDRQAPKKQRHTAKRILDRLRKEGYTGGYTQVKKAVRELAARSREVFVPLLHRPGEAQVDFGFAAVKVAGELRQVVFFVMALPYSDGFFVAAFEHLCLEVFWEGHMRAFEFFGGVPYRITYDNDGDAKLEGEFFFAPHVKIGSYAQIGFYAKPSVKATVGISEAGYDPSLYHPVIAKGGASLEGGFAVGAKIRVLPKNKYFCVDVRGEASVGISGKLALEEGAMGTPVLTGQANVGDADLTVSAFVTFGGEVYSYSHIWHMWDGVDLPENPAVLFDFGLFALTK